MIIPTEFWLAYGAYLAWLLAGSADFICHWRTNLRNTSGVAESATHLIQLGLLAAAVVLGLTFEVGKSSALLIGVLVIAHAVVGYVDTRIAFGRHRVVLPVEQHIHSVLDMAPLVAFAWLMTTTWPAATTAGWGLSLRQPGTPVIVWAAILLPAALLCVGPALIEFRAAWKTARMSGI